MCNDITTCLETLVLMIMRMRMRAMPSLRYDSVIRCIWNDCPNKFPEVIEALSRSYSMNN